MQTLNSIMTHKQKANWLTDYINRIENEIITDKVDRLFDSAKYFEVFAKDVCCAWFNTCVKLLNKKSEYPGVDLFVSDGTYVQVTTEKNLQTKIRKTLTEIENSDDSRLQDVKIVYFFILSNNNENKLKDEHIGRFDFNPSDNLISTSSVKSKVKNDFQFCNILYDRLYYADTELTSCSRKINTFFEAAKRYYRRHRASLLFQRDTVLPDSKVLMIAGEGWAGKTTFALSCVKEESDFLVLWGDDLSRRGSLSEVFGFDITLYLSLSKNPLVIFLENLHHCDWSESAEQILYHLFELTNRFDNVRLIITCSATDSGWDDFFRKNCIQTFRVPPLSDCELETVIIEHQNLASGIKWQPLRGVIHNPAMLAIILKNVPNNIVLDSVQTLRDAVWKRIDKCRHNVFTHVVLNCLRIGCPDTAEDDYDITQVESLRRDGFIVTGREGRVRPASSFYSETAIFRYLSGKFYDSGRDFHDFFQDIQLDRQVASVYIVNWIKEFIEESYENQSSVLRYLFASVSSIDDDRRLLLRAVAGSDGIYDNLKAFIHNELNTLVLSHVINSVNTDGFRNSGGKRIPCGDMRVCLMLSDIDTISMSQRLSWAAQYAEYETKETEKSVVAARILVDYLDSQKNDYDIPSRDIHCYMRLYLTALSKLSDTAFDVVGPFLDNLITTGIHDDRYTREIALLAVDSSCCMFAKTFPKKMTKLGEKIWFYPRKKKSNSLSSVEDLFGLMHKEIILPDSLSDMTKADYSFFCLLFYFHFDYAVKWMIGFLNKAVCNFSENSKQGLDEILISRPYGTGKIYLGNCDFWVLHFRNTSFPRVLKGVSRAFFNVICLKIEEIICKGENLAEFMNPVLDYILEHSNNVIPLSVLSTVGTMYLNELPGFCIPFVSDVRILDWDFFRVGSESEDSSLQLDSFSRFSSHIAPFCNEAEILVTIIENRPRLPLTIVFQLYYKLSDALASRCSDAVCCLWSSLPENADGRTRYLVWQIDLHKEDDGKYYGSEPDETVLRYIRQVELELEKTYLHVNFSLEKENNDFSLEQCEEILSQKLNKTNILEELFRYRLLLYILKQKSLELDKREKYINELPDWDRLRSLPQQQVLSVLLMQSRFSVSRNTEVKILKILYFSLLDIKPGRYKIPMLLKDFPVISSRLFHTLIWDSMLYKNHDNGIRRGDREYFTELGEYLYGDKMSDCKHLDFYNCNLDILVSVFYCGLSIENEEFCHFLRQLIQFLLEQNSVLNIGYTVSSYLATQLFESDSDRVIDLLFSMVDDSMPQWMVGLYRKSLDIACRYYDGWRVPGDREKIKKIISSIEKVKKSKVQEGSELDSALNLVLILYPSNSCGLWKNIETHYSDSDKNFLIGQYEKYCESNPVEVIQAAIEMNLNELMPEALPVIAHAFTRIDRDSYPVLSIEIADVLEKIINDMVLFTAIKRNKGYSTDVLTILDCINPAFIDVHKLRNQFIQGIDNVQ